MAYVVNTLEVFIMAQYIDTQWEIVTYDVWGNDEDGYEVNNAFNSGMVDLRLKVKRNNPDTAHEFLSAYPSDTQIRQALDCPRVQIETTGDDTVIYVNRARDGYPLGDLRCISHSSLSPIS